MKESEIAKMFEFISEKSSNIMLDLETMSTHFNAAIISVGAAKFDHRGVQDSFYEVVDLESCQGLDIRPATIMWWLKQDKLSIEQLFNNPRPLKIVLEEFSSWAGKNPIVWGNGADFDNVILRNAYEYVGLTCPWSYKNNRCYRTMANLFSDVKPRPQGIKHCAVDDAENQARHLIEIFGSIVSHR